jgi:hypothetical protein
MPLMNGYEATKEIRKLKSCYNSNNRNTAGTGVEINENALQQV